MDIASPAVVAYVGLGANLGDPQSALTAALDALDALSGTRLDASSSLYETVPVDADGPAYLNAVARLYTSLPAPELLAHLLAVERRHGRERSYRHAPRTLDLDLLLYGDQVIELPGLTVPHPRLHGRAFVLVPLLELAPDIEIPRLGPASRWLARVADQGVNKRP